MRRERRECVSQSHDKRAAPYALRNALLHADLSSANAVHIGGKTSTNPGDFMQSRLVVVSNRLPLVFRRDADRWVATPGSGGLVTALLPVLRHRGGTWIGWPGVPADGADTNELDAALRTTGRTAGYALQAVHLTAEEEHK